MVPNTNRLNGVTALDMNDVWAVGLTNGDVKDQTLTEHWGGSGWTIVPSPNPGGSSALLAVGDIAQSAGFRLFKCCQCGCKWRRLGSRPGCPQVSPLFMHWDGQIWTVVDPPAGAGPQFAVAALSPSDVWSAGSGFSADNTGLFNHWDGTAWTTIPIHPLHPVVSRSER